MPIAGLPRNPDHEVSLRFTRRPLMLMTRDQSFRAGDVPLDGTIRRVWRSLATFYGGGRRLAQTENTMEDSGGRPSGPVSTPLRYLRIGLTSNIMRYGNQLSAPLLRPPITRQRQSAPPTKFYTGNVRNRPTIRTRVPSYGSRVPSLNSVIAGGEQ